MNNMTLSAVILICIVSVWGAFVIGIKVAERKYVNQPNRTASPGDGGGVGGGSGSNVVIEKVSGANVWLRGNSWMSAKGPTVEEERQSWKDEGLNYAIVASEGGGGGGGGLYTEEEMTAILNKLKKNHGEKEKEYILKTKLKHIKALRDAASVVITFGKLWGLNDAFIEESRQAWNKTQDRTILKYNPDNAYENQEAGGG